MGSADSVETPRVILVQIPNWRIRALRREHRCGRLIIVQGQIVVACCESAAEEGVKVQMTLREAQLRCPDAVVLEQSLVFEAEAFDTVTEILEQLVPEVHVVRPGVAAMSAGGPVRFYGGEEAVCEVIWGALESHGFDEARVAIADGIFAAEQAASSDSRIKIIKPGCSREFLATIGIEALVEQKMAASLKQLGLHRIGQFAALPRNQVQSRFGAAAVTLYQLAHGIDPTPLIPRSTRPGWNRSITFDDPLINSFQVVERVREVVAQLIAELDQASMVCPQICITVRTSAGISERSWRHPWYFSAKDLLNRLSWQLDEIRLADDLAEGVHGVNFAATARPMAEHSKGLFGDRPTEHLTRILIALQEKHGPEAVQVPVLDGGRLLIDRCLRVPFGTVPPRGAQRRLSQPWPGRLPGLSPGSVLPRPTRTLLEDSAGCPMRIVDGELSGTPSWFAAEPGQRQRVVAWAGPWPVWQRWWSESRTSFSRVQVVTERRQAWLLASESEKWWIEACYD